ncbi:MAG: LCP family protein [Armatimonadota bacterium]
MAKLRIRPKFLAKVRRAFITLLAVSAVLGIGLFTYFCTSSPTLRETLGIIAKGDARPAKAFAGRDEINLLILGRDLDRDQQGRVVHTRGRTDTIMLAHIDFRERTMNILSIPRDTLVRVPGYRGKRRINSAHALGGPDLVKETIKNFLGVEADDYVLINFDGFAKAIDGIGGLKVNVDKRLDYDDNWGNLHIHLKPGEQVLTGEQAMGFARYRKSKDGTGDSDFVRIGRQQELLQAARAKLANPKVIFRIPEILEHIRGDMEGDLSTAQIICLAQFMRSLDGKVHVETLPAEEGSGVYVKADPEATRTLVDELFGSTN